MSLARDINKKLDEILELRAEMKNLKDNESDDVSLVNPDTGDEFSKEDALVIAEGAVDKVKESLMKLTNSGQNIRNIFDNQFYINDMMQDKIIANQIKQNNNNK